jgi:hypothetical protein
VNRYYPWNIAAPIVASWAVYGKTLSDESMKKLINAATNTTESKAYFSGIRNWWGRGPKSVDFETVLFLQMHTE